MRRALSSLLLAGLVAAGTSAAAETAALTILHTNDTHGRLMPFRYPALARSGPGLETLPTGVELGGIARRATLAKRIAAEQAAAGVPVWLIDAGDFTDGTVFSVEYHGLADLDAMAAAGYTLGALGNHELNQPLASAAGTAGESALSAALRQRHGRSDRPAARDTVDRARGRDRCASASSACSPATPPTTPRRETVCASRARSRRRGAWPRELRERADVVVAVSHAGRQTDERIAAEVPEIDVIVGGHSHSRLPSGELIWRSQSLAVDDVGGTVLVQAHQWGGELGRLDLLFSRDAAGRWRVTRYRAELLPIGADLPAEPAVAEVVDRYWRPLQARYGEVIGQAMADFVTQGNDQADYNLVADAMRVALRTEVHLENQGGVRAPLAAGPDHARRPGGPRSLRQHARDLPPARAASWSRSCSRTGPPSRGCATASRTGAWCRRASPVAGSIRTVATSSRPTRTWPGSRCRA